MPSARPAAATRSRAPCGAPLGSFGSHDDADFTKPEKTRKWPKRTLVGVVALAVVGGGLYAGYRWTQTQYYVGAKDDHVAVYQGIDQKLAWINLSKVHKDRTDIELKYLPSYQRDKVQSTIALSSLGQANDKADELARQAAVCKKVTDAALAKAKKGQTQLPTAAWRLRQRPGRQGDSQAHHHPDGDPHAAEDHRTDHRTDTGADAGRAEAGRELHLGPAVTPGGVGSS